MEVVHDRRPKWLQRLHEWRVEHVSEKMFMIILALLVGFFAAVAAFVLHWIINQIVQLLTSSFDRTGANWLYLVYPVVGIYLTSLFVRYIVKDNISHGITRILYAISSNKSRLKSHNCWSSVIASAITIGFGGRVRASSARTTRVANSRSASQRLIRAGFAPVHNLSAQEHPSRTDSTPPHDGDARHSPPFLV